MTGKYRRKILIINKAYQWRFIATFVVLCVAGMAAAVFSVTHMVGSGLEQSMYKSHISAAGTGQIVLPIAARANLGLLLGGAALISAISFLFARRTQNMVDGFREGLGMLRDGRLDFSFNDESRHDFPELDAAFNRMVHGSRQRVDRLKSMLDGMKAPIGVLGMPGGSWSEEKEAAASELRLRTDELLSTLDEFKL